MYTQEAAGLRSAARAHSLMIASGRAIRNALLATNKGDRINDIYFMQDHLNTAKIEINKLHAFFEASSANTEAINQAETAVNDYESDLTRITTLLEQQSMEAVPPDAFRILHQEAQPKGELAEMLLEGLVLMKQNSSGELADTTEQIYASTQKVLLSLSVTGALLGLFLGLLLTRNLVRQLGGEPADVARVAKTIAEGDLSTELAGTRLAGESLMSAMQHMQHSLRDIVGAVRSSSARVAQGTEQIAEGNAALSARTEEQAANLAQTVTALEQLSGTVKNTADVAGQAAQMAASASQAASNGGTVVLQAVSMMQAIQESSSRIEQITAMIDKIAFQTNILALNAAVEAARAGQEGRGFAVVAGEVRNLAEQSAQAARQIKVLITESSEKIQVGGATMEQAGTAMSAIVSQVKHVTELIGEISAATIEQTAGLEQINNAVNHFSENVSRNAMSVEEAASGAKSLHEQALTLVDLVRGFTLETSWETVASTAHPARLAPPRSLGFATEAA